LTSGTPIIGSYLTSGGFTFEVVHKNSSNQQVLCIGPVNLPTNTFWVNTRPLREGIKAKVKKYRALGYQGIPLVIGVVADFYSGLGHDDLENVLFGNEAVELAYERTTGDIVGQRAVRQDNGLLEQIDPALSAVLWVSQEAGVWKVQSIHNPRASNPLPIAAFG
jgi:hypothetical protein